LGLEIDLNTPSDLGFEVKSDTSTIKETKELESDNELGLDIELDDEKEGLALDIEIEDTTPPPPPQTPEPPKEDITIDINLENNTEEEVELELDIGDDDTDIQIEEEEEDIDIDLGLDIVPQATENIKITISKEDIDKELENASKELSIDSQTIQQFFEDFKQQVMDEKDVFFNAINNKDYETLHKSSHKLKGVALNLRLDQLGEIFKKIDELAKSKQDINTIKDNLINIYNVIENLDNSSPAPAPKNGITINKDIAEDEKRILLKSLSDFLDTIKNQEVAQMKKNLISAYNLIPIEELKEAQNIDSQKEIVEFIDKLQEEIKKEIKWDNYYLYL